jgi:predicted DNA-binding transcriptional regulator YafY
MINKGIIEPRTKSKRKAAIEKLLSQMSPEAKRKLESIAVRQLTAKEISAEDQAVLDKVADIIRKERGK